MCRQIPIGAAHISFSGHTQIVQGTGRPAQSYPWWPPAADRWTNTQRSTGPGGLNKMTLRLRKPMGKRLGEANGKTNVGPCWRSFIQRELSRGPHNTQPCKERKIKEHNTGMTETRAARVEQNTRHNAEPSTLYQVYRCIN